MALCGSLCVVVLALYVLVVTGVKRDDTLYPDPMLYWRHLNLSKGIGRIKELANMCLHPEWTMLETACGEGHCRCNRTAAHCFTRGEGTLTYVPSLPVGITRLNFANNGLSAIKHDYFFQNVTNIVVLDLGANDLSYISAGAFRPLLKLKSLWLYLNKLTYRTLTPVLSVNTLTRLDLTYNLLGAPPAGLFHNYTMSHLNILCLVAVKMNSINMSVFAPLPNLKYLSLAINTLSSDTYTPGYLPRLEALALKSNSFDSFPKTCADFGSFMPNLKWLDLSRNSLYLLFSPSVCLPLLETFISLSSFISTILSNTFGEHLFPSLTTVIVSSNIRPFEIERYAFNNSMIKFIILRESGINFFEDSVHPDCFAGCANLTFLHLGKNDFSGVSTQKYQRLFNNKEVKFLSLSSCQIGSVREETFENLPRLSFLYLDSNKLTYIPDGAFDRFQYLEGLDLSSNRISVITKNTFSPATRQRLRCLNIGINPFQCDCDLRWFKQLLLTQTSILSYCSIYLIHTHASYTCDNLVNTTVQSFYVADQACLWSPAVSKFIIATVILLTLPVTAAAVVYRYRWHIRLVLYEAVRGRGDRWRRLQKQNFRYDVFVSFDSEDLHWVRVHLMPELEEILGLRLCIHSRDFTLGAPIVENIEESVETSKKILTIFSKNFVKSHWCQFELQLCITHVLKHGDTLIVVLLENIPPRELTPAMIAVIKTLTYIEWEDEPEARASFWGRIRLALNEILA